MKDAGYWAMIGVVFTAAAGAFVSVFQFLKTARAEASKIQIESRTADLDEARKFRDELRGEIKDMRGRMNEMENELHHAQGQIIKQRELFVGILYKLEGIMTLKDIQIVSESLKTLVSDVRRILDMPVGGPELILKQLKQMDGQVEDV